MCPKSSAIYLQVLPVIITALATPRTCLDVRKNGGESGWYNLDPDWDGQGEFSVFCDVTADPVTATLQHNQEEMKKVLGYEDDESYVAEIVFDNNVDTAQARSLVMASESCSYYLSMLCEDIDPPAISWTSFYGGKRSFLFLEGTFCTDDVGRRTCTCDVSVVKNAVADTGDAGNWPFFPILSFNIGDTGNAKKEWVEYSLGPLICKQAEAVIYRWFDTNPGMRQSAEVTVDDKATTAGKCAMSCIRSDSCISFNFMKSPTPICELSSLPRNALAAVYGNTAAGWSHYNIRIY